MIHRVGFGLVLSGLLTVLATVVAMLAHASGTAAPLFAALAAAAGGVQLVAGMLVLERANTSDRAALQTLA